MNTPETVALRLVRAYAQGAPIAVDPEEGPVSVDAAYAAQRAVWQAMVGARRPTAWKVGAVSREAVPLAAPVFPQRLLASGDTFPKAGLLGVEAEIAVRFGRDLPPRAQPYSRAEIIAAIASVHCAMEVVATRLADTEAAGPLWRLADHLLNGALVLGDALPDWHGLDWDRLALQVRLDGLSMGAIQGRPPLGDLFHCLPWWLDHVGGVLAGDIVTTGAWSGVHRIEAAREVTVAFAAPGGEVCTTLRLGD